MHEIFPVLHGKTAIVTGASSGIGLATARLLAENGVRVGLVSRSTNLLEELSATLPGSRAFPADMTKIPQIRQMVKKVQEYFGRIDILVNCAGTRGPVGVSIADGDEKDWRLMFDVNSLGTMIVSKAVAKEKGVAVAVKMAAGMKKESR